MSDRPHLSPSQLDTYCRCPEQYRRRYIERERSLPGMAMLRGTGLHRAAEFNMRQKIDSHVDLPVKEIVDVAVAAFEAERNGGYFLTQEEVFVGTDKIIGKTTQVVASLAKVHAEVQAPDYQPLFVEERVRIVLPGNRDMVGVIDLADDEGNVIDLKTTGKAKSQSEADSSVQLTVYAAGFTALTGEPTASVRFDNLVIGKKGVRRQLTESQRGPGDFLALANRINAVTRGIESGNFPPAAPGSWFCSPKWCNFWSTCPYVNSERAALAEGDE